MNEIDLGLELEERPVISKTEREILYREVLYTIKHKIGRTMDGHSDYINDLYLYAKEAFGMSNEDHKRLYSITNEDKVSFN